MSLRHATRASAWAAARDAAKRLPRSRKPSAKLTKGEKDFVAAAHQGLAEMRKRINGPVRKPSANRAAAMRKAFVRRFGPWDATKEWVHARAAFAAGAAWQRRQKGRP